MRSPPALTSTPTSQPGEPEIEAPPSLGCRGRRVRGARLCSRRAGTDWPYVIGALTLLGIAPPASAARGKRVDHEGWTWIDCEEREVPQCADGAVHVVERDAFPYLESHGFADATPVVFLGPDKQAAPFPRSTRRTGRMRDDFVAFSPAGGSRGEWILADRVSGATRSVRCPPVVDGLENVRIEEDPWRVFFPRSAGDEHADPYVGAEIDREALTVLCRVASLDGRPSVHQRWLFFQLTADSEGATTWIERSPGNPLALWRPQSGSPLYAGVDQLVAHLQGEEAKLEANVQAWKQREAQAAAQDPRNTPFGAGSWCIGWAFDSADGETTWVLGDLNIARDTTLGELNLLVANSLSNSFMQEAHLAGLKIRAIGSVTGPRPPFQAHAIEPRPCAMVADLPGRIGQTFTLRWP